MAIAALERTQQLLQKRDHGFRWRGREVSRIEALSDGVFAFCITLLVVSLEPPRTFSALMHMMRGFPSFALCFVLLILIWYTQYVFFRRYALDDSTSFLLNAALLLVVALYVYPLKFLMTVLVNMLTGYKELDASGRVIQALAWRDWRPLMLIYSSGFIALYGIFALLYWHAYRLRHALELNALEIFETRSVILENVLMAGLGVISLSFAVVNIPQLSGMTYFLIGPLQTWLGFRQSKGRQRMMEAAQIAA